MQAKEKSSYQTEDEKRGNGWKYLRIRRSLKECLMRGSMMIEGRIARFVYISLYRMHQIALHGYFKTGLMMLVGSINRVIRPRLKLH